MGKYILICLSEVSVLELNMIFESQLSSQGIAAVWIPEYSSDIQEWCNNRSYRLHVITGALTTQIPLPNGSCLHLPASLWNTKDLYFLIKPVISKDHYLQGCIYHIAETFMKGKVTDPDFADKMLESYLYFNKSTFLALSNGPVSGVFSGNAYFMDNLLIVQNRLHKKRLYRKLYTFLDLSALTGKNIPAEFTPCYRDENLYPSGFLRQSINRAVKEFFTKYRNAAKQLVSLFGRKVLKIN